MVDAPECMLDGKHGVGQVLARAEEAWPGLLEARCHGTLRSVDERDTCDCGESTTHMWELTWNDGPSAKDVARRLLGYEGGVDELGRTLVPLPCGAATFLTRRVTLRRVAEAVISVGWTQEEWAEAVLGDRPEAVFDAVTRNLQGRGGRELELAATLLVDAAGLDAQKVATRRDAVSLAVAASRDADPAELLSMARRALRSR